jgi:hypothetical protein
MENILYKCGFCEFETKWKYNLPRHKKSAHPNNRSRFECHLCEKVYTSVINLKRHLKNFHKKRKYNTCNSIDQFFQPYETHLNPSFVKTVSCYSTLGSI